MKSQKQKMFDGEPYDAHSEEMVNIRKRTKKILHRLNVTEYYSDNFKEVMNELLPNSARNVHFEPRSTATTAIIYMPGIKYS
ncbi:maltose acetyltransferase domain-containing protein [Arcticibacter sp. MXS-1]|uniref:maltose acetyltransferase domain-containing protein n=1 Tax=Arcticibacter sp. MXS-1 TaxID=3341726 RepID=UPI0035A8B8EE